MLPRAIFLDVREGAEIDRMTLSGEILELVEGADLVALVRRERNTVDERENPQGVRLYPMRGLAARRRRSWVSR